MLALANNSQTMETKSHFLSFESLYQLEWKWHLIKSFSLLTISFEMWSNHFLLILPRVFLFILQSYLAFFPLCFLFLFYFALRGVLSFLLFSLCFCFLDFLIFQVSHNCSNLVSLLDEMTGILWVQHAAVQVNCAVKEVQLALCNPFLCTFTIQIFNDKTSDCIKKMGEIKQGLLVFTYLSIKVCWNL